MAKSQETLSAVQGEKQLRKTLTPDEYLPVTTIKSYFSRRTQLIAGKIFDDSVEEDDGDTESDEGKEEGSGRRKKKDSESELVEDEWMEKEISHIVTVISVAVSGVNVVKDE